MNLLEINYVMILTIDCLIISTPLFHVLISPIPAFMYFREEIESQ